MSKLIGYVVVYLVMLCLGNFSCRVPKILCKPLKSERHQVKSLDINLFQSIFRGAVLHCVAHILQVCYRDAGLTNSGISPRLPWAGCWTAGAA